MPDPIAIVFPGDPSARSTWSGTPAGLLGAMRELGLDVRPTSAQPARPIEFAVRNSVAALHVHRARRENIRETIRFARRVARVSPQIAFSQSWTARLRLARQGRLGGIVQIGTGYSVPTDIPVVTFEDLTIRQAVALRYPEWIALSPRAIKARIARQTDAYERARACCVTTRAAAKSVVEDYGVASEKVHVVGVGRNHTATVDRRDWSTPHFLFIGKDWEGKNGEAVVRAFERLRRDIPEATLDIVGNHPPLDSAGVTGHGPLSLDDPASRRRIEALYRRATCFVLPSHYEASALVYVEAGAAGLPCIGTINGGTHDLVGDAGRLVDPLDDEGLYQAMRELSNPATAEALGAIARKRAPLFSWRAVAERIVRALQLPGVRLETYAEFL